MEHDYVTDSTMGSGLQASTALQGYRFASADLLAEETQQHTIVSLAFSHNGTARLNQNLQHQFGLSLPVVGQLCRNHTGISLLRLQSDQCFLVTSELWQHPVRHLHSLLDECAFYTDQSDSWVMIDIVGPSWRLMMERICPLDLSADKFTTSHVARTLMEHVSVIIERPEQQRLRLYSPRSSAMSFAQSVSLSMSYISTQTNFED